MTLEQLQEVINLPPDKAVEALRVREVSIPDWSEVLVKEYDALLHPIMTDFARYPKKLNAAGRDLFRRIPLAMQALAVDKQAQAIYNEDVLRKYSLQDNPQMEEARDLLEDNLKVVNNIDSTNIERAKELFKCCEVATIYKLDITTPSIVNQLPVNNKLEHHIYSPVQGYDLHPYYDERHKLVGLGIEYTAQEYEDGKMVDVGYFVVNLIGGVIVYNDKDDWQVISVEKTGVDFLLASYISIPAPIWKGKECSELVELMEELVSKNQLYIDKNQVPMYKFYRGKNTVAKEKGDITEDDEDARRIIEVGEDGVLEAVAWKGAEDAASKQFQLLLEQFYQQVQIFDNRPSSMQAKAMSAENKEILMFDAKARAKDIAGELLILHQEEFSIFKRLTAIQFPSHRANLELLSARSVITPYSLHTKKDTSEYVATNRASGVMSKRTGVALLGEVDDIEQELLNIAEEQQADNNF